MTQTEIMRYLQELIPDPSPVEFLRAFATIQYFYDKYQKPEGGFYWNIPAAGWNTCAREIQAGLGFRIFPENIPQSSKKAFTSIFDAFAKMDLADFCRDYLPADFLAQPSEVFAILQKKQIRFRRYKALAIAFAKESDGTLENAPKFVHGIFGEKWKDFYRAVNFYPFHRKCEVGTDQQAVYNIFREHGCSDGEYMIAYFNCVKEKNAVFSYSGTMERGVDYFKLDRDKQILAEKIARVGAYTDFLEVALQDTKENDIAVECDFLFTRFTEHQCFLPDESVLIVNPAPHFIVQYAKNTALAKKTTFAIQSPAATVSLCRQFKHSTFLSMQELEMCNRKFHKILVFGRGLSQTQIDQIMWSLPNWSMENAAIDCVIPEHMLTWEDPAKTPLSKFSLTQVDLLPPETFRSRPKKKTLVKMRYAACKADIQVVKYEKVGKRKTYLQAVEREKVSFDQLSSTLTIRDVLRKTKAGKKATGVQRKHPERYDFTKDIAFWYRVGNRNHQMLVTAYACQPPTKTQMKRNLLERGAAIKETETQISTLKTRQALDAWLEGEYPYLPVVHKAAVASFAKTAAENLTIKTLWYLSLDHNNLENAAVDEEAQQLIVSAVGAVRYGDDSALQEAMDAFCQDFPMRKRVFYWRLLCNILRRVRNVGIVVTNNYPEGVLRTLRRAEDGQISEVKEALALRDLTLQQENILLKYVLKRILECWEFVGVLMRMILGLPPNIVCAFTWRDLRKGAQMPFRQLCIVKQWRNDSNEPVPFQDAESYRCVPVPSMLAEVLLKRKKQLLAKYGEIDDWQIIAKEPEALSGAPVNIMPRQLHKLSREALEVVNLADQIVDLPDKNGTIETNLARVTRDIFVTNFRYRAKETCGMTDAEIRFMQGRAQKTPFARNYCDYQNDLCQFSIYKKLERWVHVHHSMEKKEAAKRGTFQNRNVFGMQNIQSSLVLEIPVRGEMTVQLDCDFGAEIHVSFLCEEEAE